MPPKTRFIEPMLLLRTEKLPEDTKNGGVPVAEAGDGGAV